MKTHELATQFSETEGSGVLACLDSPQSGTYAEASPIQVTGWIASQQEVELFIVRSEGQRIHVPFNVRRPDVHAKEIKDASASDLVGFTVTTPFDDSMELIIKVGSRYVSWCKIQAHKVAHPEVWAACQAFYSNRIADISNHATRLAASLSLQDFRDSFLQNIKHVSASESRRLFPEASDTDHEEFLRAVSDDMAFAQFTTSALERGAIVIPSPFGNGKASCSDSLHLIHNITALRFVDEETSEAFYILQHVTSVDAIYFPARKLFIHFQYLTPRTLEDCAYYIVRDMPSGIERAKRAARAKFLGVSTAPNGPYHFFYNIAPALHHLSQAGLLDRTMMIVDCPGGDFINTAEIFNQPAKRALLDHSSMNAKCDELSGFFMHAGMRYGSQAEPLIPGLDAKLKARVKPHPIEGLLGSHFVLWVGINSQKRRWVEQIDGIVALVERISRENPKLIVLIDGWTSPITKTDRDLREEAADKAIADHLVRRIKQPTVSLIGLTPLNKMAFAARADFFLTSYFTASIYVSRFFGKPGIGHLSTRMEKTGHIHSQITSVPSEMITDVPDPSNPRLDFVSYSIDPKQIVSLYSSLMNGAGPSRAAAS
jgi:hypothetical protein